MKSSWLVLLAYLIAGFALFGPFLDNPFLMDDEIQVTRNVHIQNIQEWPSYFTSSTMDSGGSAKMGGIYFKPLMTLYFAGIWHFFPGDPLPFRVPLLLMHVLSSFFIFLFLARWFDRRLAFAAGLLFVLHPINSEIVIYIADAQDALYMFFGLLGLTAFFAIRSTAKASWVFALCAMCALLGKETGALFLAIVPIAAFLFDRPRFRPALIAACLTFAAYMALRVNSGLLSYEHRVLLIQQATYLERLMTVPLIVWHYIEIFFVPWRISLVADFVVHSMNGVQFWAPLAGVVAFSALLLTLWRAIERDRSERGMMDRKLFLFGLSLLALWFLLHGSVLLPLDGTYADRWFYIGGWAFLIFGCLALKRLNINMRGVMVGTAVIGLIFAARTFVRLEDWSTPMNLYQREFAQRPFDAIMANNVGFEYFHRGDLRSAERYFEIATQNNPSWDVAWNNLGATAQNLGETARAMDLYKKSVSLGTYYLAYENYAALLCSRAVDQECRDFLARALQALPLNPKLNQIRDAVAAQGSGK